jgi:hypothetical protein
MLQSKDKTSIRGDKQIIIIKFTLFILTICNVLLPFSKQILIIPSNPLLKYVITAKSLNTMNETFISKNRSYENLENILNENTNFASALACVQGGYK